eukprot:g33563.t1
MAASCRWEVVGGSDKGGVLVRDGQSTSSTQLEDRLATGSRILALSLFQTGLITGQGPPTGWVSISLKGKELLRSVRGQVH